MGFFKKRTLKLPCKDKYRIGICATGHNVGATTLSLALAGYLRSKRMKKTAYLEINGTGEISTLTGSTADSFTHNGITLIPHVTFRSLPDILTLSYDFFVLDFGLLHPNNYREFMQCDLGLLIGSIAPWKQQQFGAFVKKHFPNGTTLPENIRCLAALGIKEQETAFRRRFHIPVSNFPYLENPFQLSSSDWQFLQLLLENAGI